MTTLVTIRDNLTATVAGKVEYQKKLRASLRRADIDYSPEGTLAVIDFLDLNIEELKRILADVQSILDRADAILRTT